MTQLPRVALGTVQPREDPRFVLWGLMDVLDQAGLLVQSFSSQSRLESREAASLITGQGRRHLDSWLMAPDLCAELFLEGSRCADVRVVDGQFDVAAGVATNETPAGGSLDALCAWLDLPRVAVINAQRIGRCSLPRMPSGIEGIILDRVESIKELCRLQTMCEAFYGAPVLGAMGENREMRAAVTELFPDDVPSVEMCRALGQSLATHFRFDRFFELASRREFDRLASVFFRERSAAGPLSIAVAHDKAFDCHFPNILDIFELQGATVNYFSPLSDESLPPATDVVYLSCGRIEHCVSELAANVCMKESLRRHVASGNRVYAEGAGLAYICRAAAMADGREWPMAGLLPTVADYHRRGGCEHAVEIDTSRGSWLFSPRQHMRGYLDPSWTIRPDGGEGFRLLKAACNHALLGDYQVVGSRIHLDFTACPDLVERFFQPYRGNPLNPVL